MPAMLNIGDAALAGLASSMRSTVGLALLVTRGRISGRVGRVILLAAVGELIADKTPAAPDRTAPPSVAVRAAAGAYTGRAIGGSPGAVIAGLSAAVGTFATFHARAWAVRRTGWPDPLVAVGEDVLALTSAAIATRPVR
jgi:uncharacterized membrane protein